MAIMSRVFDGLYGNQVFKNVSEKEAEQILLNLPDRLSDPFTAQVFDSSKTRKRKGTNVLQYYSRDNKLVASYDMVSRKLLIYYPRPTSWRV